MENRYMQRDNLETPRRNILQINMMFMGEPQKRQIAKMFRINSTDFFKVEGKYGLTTRKHIS